MSSRANRRAAERKSTTPQTSATAATTEATEKTAAASVGSAFPVPEPEPAHQQPLSDARLAANRANAQHSSGPRSTEGKAKSSMNAVKTGLTGRTILLPSDDVEVYQAHIASHLARHSPATDEERTLVQFIADTEWRLLRIAPFESGIFAVARLEMPDLYITESNHANREALIDTKIMLTYERQLKNLGLQERRLRNQYNADIARLQQIQQNRLNQQTQAEKAEKQHSMSRLDRAMIIHQQCGKHRVRFDPRSFGFDFSLPEFEYYLRRHNEHYPLTGEYLDLDQVLAEYRAAQKEAQAA